MNEIVTLTEQKNPPGATLLKTKGSSHEKKGAGLLSD